MALSVDLTPEKAALFISHACKPPIAEGYIERISPRAGRPCNPQSADADCAHERRARAARVADRGRRSTSEDFDTLTAAKTLRGAEFDERQAEAIATVVRRAPSADRSDLATKADLAELEARITRALWLQAAGLVAIMGSLKIFG